tara:strand:- start:330 stop:1232 length:903 start_codon:yes stop_codon:yes gene_type:complete
MKLSSHIILFFFTGGLGNLIWFFFFRESNNSLLGIFGAKSMTGDKVLDHVFRNAPPQYEIVIRNGSNQNFVNLHLELGKWTNNMHSEIVGRLSQLGYELPYPEEMETDEAALRIHDEIKQEFYPEGIRLINQLAPFHERPDFVFPRPENGTNYSVEEFDNWYENTFNQILPVFDEYNQLNEEWNDMMFDIANMQVLADKATMELEAANLNLQMNAASLQEQRRHNIAMEQAAKKASQPKSGSILGGVARGLGRAAAANYRMVQENQNKPVIYKCLKCKRLHTFSFPKPGMKCCGQTLMRQ